MITNNKKELEWTGERYVPHLRGTIALEHLHRYAYACEFVQGKVVLDIASGEGYGSEMLSRTAAHVYGVDVDKKSVFHAAEKYQKDNLEFILGSCEKIPLPDHSVDLIVSFETIEHTEQHDLVLLEMKRVLKPDGFLIISSPEKADYHEKRNEKNPFHLHELGFEEFQRLLLKHFPLCSFFGQRIISGSQIYKFGEDIQPVSAYEFACLPTTTDKFKSDFRPSYILGICGKTNLFAAYGSFCIQKPWETDCYRELNTQVAEKDKQIAEKDKQIAEKDKQIAEKGSRITHLKRSIARMESSLIWRTSWPLRFLHKKIDIIYKRCFKKIIIGIKIIFSHYKSGVFDSIWYSQQIPNYKNFFRMPLLHFAFFGVYENRSPNSRFDRKSYENMNPEWKKYSDSSLLDFTLRGYDNATYLNINKYLIRQQKEVFIQKIESLLDLIAYSKIGIHSKKHSSNLNKLISRLNAALLLKVSSTSKSPDVSVIIPVFNQIHYTLACLISLFESQPNSDFEVIIADDCSTDETSTIFSKFSDRIRVIRTPGNLGFLKNCNNAAKHARGEFVVFLNNDMVLFPEWMDALVATISKDRECGMVGSKLLNLDGTLQEAGGIFWKDGSAWNYGRNQNPMAPEFNYKKEVDYCSGASICLRKEVWDSLGGFDEIFAPAYCEESDLSFRLRARGLKTIYQPRSVGIHLEGVSCGTDTTQGIKAYQVENLKKLQARWSDVLKKEHFPNGEQVFLARDRSAKKRHMLFVDHYLPRPDYDAGSRQMATYLQVFVEMGFQISFWPDNLGYDKEYALPLEELGIEVISCNGDFISFEEWIKKNGEYIDVAFLSRPYVALKYIQGLKENSKASIVFYGHDIHSLRTKGELEFNPADQALLARLVNEQEEETKCWEKCDVIFYPSIDEKNHIAENFPLINVDILPLYCKSDEEILAAKTITEFDKRSGILFVGGFGHSPNKDGILWFCNEILPLIREISPDVCLTIAGSNPPEEVRRLESEFIKVTGRVSDQQLSAFYENHRVAIAPLRFGGGVKGKVVESMLKGLPMVTTKVGSQGLKATAKDLVIAYSECEFADKVIELLIDEKKWLQQRDFGETFFIENFSSKKIKNKLKKILQ